ncbi:substrate import-associated zinc metallohydrolase lipoprotein [Pedobacter agri]|uniref:substrate import-associated zinc metallohydrolase lipoprotein n=1 Tax=Pedobacter agri TaxID=454586 RepID=UPI002789557C|nr:substrate import-associated zinc metallohydrolase lipoprotein [Pedobacter agri]MDQ1140247.1 substrate import-associated zinc metallohydrolase lipoprotein [Pedobacter agri]
MKKNIFKIFAILLIVGLANSCKKEEALNVDFSQYNIDNPVANTALDKWLTTTFLDEYNIDVIYRYNRFYHGDDRDVASVKVDKVQAQMQTVLEGFILPYRKIAGTAFIKKMVPKQFVLFGSGSYNPDNSYTLATAAAGRNITIYAVNDFNVNVPGDVVGKLKTIHHEFTHTLNQIVPMPDDFQNITKSTYLATWTTTPDAVARDNGYVTPYASSQPGEDFAETVSHLLVFGQAWFDARANSSTAIGKAALKAKEASVVQYFTNMGIDFRSLQMEIQNIVRNQYKYQQASFRYWMGQNLYKTMTINLEDGVYAANGISSEFATAYNNFKAAVLAYSSTQKYHLDFVQLRFESTNVLTVRAAFSNATTQYFGDYSFNYTINTTTGAVTFTKVANATGTTFSNGALFTVPFTNTIQAYLTGKTFIADWLPPTITSANYNSYGGFYLQGTPTNNFYGLLGQTL